MTGYARRLPSWVYTPNAGWSLFYIAFVLMVLGAFFGLSGSPLTLYILGSLAVVLSLVGGIWALINEEKVYLVYFVKHSSEEDDGCIYLAHVPALSIVIEGRTIADAGDKARGAVKEYVQRARGQGKLLPDDVIVSSVRV